MGLYDEHTHVSDVTMTRREYKAPPRATNQRVTEPHISTRPARRTMAIQADDTLARGIALLYNETTAHGVAHSLAKTACEQRYLTWQGPGRSLGNPSVLSAWGRPLGCCWLPKTPSRCRLSQDPR